jgi:potassium/hydrogen antiporter
MSLTAFFALLGGLLVLAFVANRLGRRTGVPDVLVLLAVGLILGPVTHILDPSRFDPITRGLGTFALLLILFEAGLELDVRDTLRHFPGSLLLALLTYGIGTVGAGFLCQYALGLPRPTAFLVGAVMGCASSSIVIPVLQQLELPPSMKVTLTVEASFSDALGALTVGVLFGLESGSKPTGVYAWLLQRLGFATATSFSLMGRLAGGFLGRMGMAIALSALAGFIWTRMLPLISEQRFWRVLTLAATLLVYSAVQAAGGSELFAVMVFGFILSNFPHERSRKPGVASVALATGSSSVGGLAQHQEVLAFNAEIGFLIRSFFFVLIGVVSNFSGLRTQFLQSVGILATLLVARWVAVQISRVAWRGTTRADRELACLLIPRGLINAVLALEVVEVRRGLDFLPSLAFAVILLSNLLMVVGTVRTRRLVSAEAEAAALGANSAAIFHEGSVPTRGAPENIANG